MHNGVCSGGMGGKRTKKKLIIQVFILRLVIDVYVWMKLFLDKMMGVLTAFCRQDWKVSDCG